MDFEEWFFDLLEWWRAFKAGGRVDSASHLMRVVAAEFDETYSAHVGRMNAESVALSVIRVYEAVKCRASKK